MPSPALPLDDHLIRRYDRPGPRYTSYPTVPVWREDFGTRGVEEALRRADETPEQPLDLYVHLPFCRHRCLFCACNVVLGRRDDLVDAYLGRLERQMDQVRQRMPARRRVSALHWGGGTPTHLDVAQIVRLRSSIAARFDLSGCEEQSIEIHPTVTTDEQLRALRGLGFDRVSLGVQDLAWEVQELVERWQTVEQTEHALELARTLGFRGVNFDLIYGLPGQTAQTWSFTLEQTLRMRPDRLAVYGFAWVPWMHPHQKRALEERLPGREDRAHYRRQARNALVEAGYVEIGFDHYALPDDPLAHAAGRGELHRNFMGFTDRPAQDYLGFGMTAISMIGGAFWQNPAKLNRFNEAVDAGELAAERGWELSEEDWLRREIIESLLCNMWVELKPLEEILGAHLGRRWPETWAALEEMERDGVVLLGERAIRITPLGRPYARNVAMLFDAHLDQQAARQRYSQTV